LIRLYLHQTFADLDNWEAFFKVLMQLSRPAGLYNSWLTQMSKVFR